MSAPAVAPTPVAIDSPKSQPEAAGQEAFADVESQEVPSSPKIAADSKPRCRGRPKTVGCAVCCGLTVVVALTLALVFWPQDPSWHVTYLHTDEAAFMGFVMAVLSRSNTSLPPLFFDVEVGLFNPNYIGAYAVPSRFTIDYGSILLGEGQGDAVHVRPRSDSPVHAIINVTVPTKVVHQLTDEVHKHRDGTLPISVSVHGATTAHVSWLKLKCTMHCQVTADLIKLMTPENRPKTVLDKACTYKYGL